KHRFANINTDRMDLHVIPPKQQFCADRVTQRRTIPVSRRVGILLAAHLKPERQYSFVTEAVRWSCLLTLHALCRLTPRPA
ncbi:MAG: hypothetical protein ABSA78_21485, partial [Candidatus Sulfotelmatobacter sp.]